MQLPCSLTFTDSKRNVQHTRYVYMGEKEGTTHELAKERHGDQP